VNKWILNATPFVFSIEFLIIGYHSPGKLRRAGSQDTDLSCRVALCDHNAHSLQTEGQTDVILVAIITCHAKIGSRPSNAWVFQITKWSKSKESRSELFNWQCVCLLRDNVECYCGTGCGLVSICLSVCYKPILYRNGWTDWAQWIHLNFLITQFR